MSNDDIGDIDDMPPLMGETPVAQIKLEDLAKPLIEEVVEEVIEEVIEEEIKEVIEEEADTSTIEEVYANVRRRFTSPGTSHRQWRREIPQFDWNDAIEAEMMRFTPMQYIQYTFEATVFTGVLFPRMILMPASLMMTQHFIDLFRQVARPNVMRDDEKVVKCIAVLVLLLINVYYMGRILGFIE